MHPFKGAYVARFNREIHAYFYDFLALYQYSAICGNGAQKRVINAALRKACLAAAAPTEEACKKARKILKPFLSGNARTDFTLYATGHAHLDLGWLWPIRETKRKAERTFSNALANIEKYPDYVFGASQPQQFEWMKNNRPALYAKIKKAVKDGRIEPQGCMWVEPDTNVPSGESLIRQCKYGKAFWKDEFGIDCDMLWVPDVFGYSGNLPQILRGCGADRFMTIKLSWNTVNKFPYHSFVWHGIDDSEVLVHMPPEGDYNSTASPIAAKVTEDNYREQDLIISRLCHLLNKSLFVIRLERTSERASSRFFIRTACRGESRKQQYENYGNDKKRFTFTIHIIKSPRYRKVLRSSRL